MSKDNKNRSLSNMLRERGSENKASSDDNQNPFPTDKNFEQNLSTVEKKDAGGKKAGSNWIKNLLIFVICIVLPVLSYYDYINLPFFGNADNNSATEVIDDFEEGFADGYSDASATNGLDLSYNEYLQKLNSGELGREFPSWEIDHLFEASVPVTYLEQIEQADMLNGLEYWEISTLFSNNVTVDYLKELDQAEIFSTWEAWEIGNFYEDGVTASFLSDLAETGVLEDFSSAEITRLYNSGVSAEQIRSVSEELNFKNTSVNEIVDRVGN